MPNILTLKKKRNPLICVLTNKEVLKSRTVSLPTFVLTKLFWLLSCLKVHINFRIYLSILRKQKTEPKGAGTVGIINKIILDL